MRAYSLAAAGLIWCVLAASDEPRRPTRSECTTGYRLDWSQVMEQKDATTNAIGEVPLGSPVFEYMGGFGISLDQSKVYLIFHSNCDKKWEMSDSLIEYWRSRDLNLPKFERITEPIFHSPQTFDISGPPWRD